MDTNQVEHPETLTDQERLAPLKIFTQHASGALASALKKHPELELSGEVDLQTARENVAAGVDFDLVNFKMVSGSLKAARESGAEVLFFTNEGQDQLGVCAKNGEQGNLQLFTPHQIVLLVSEIALEQFKSKDAAEGEKEPVILRSIVLTDACEVQAAYKEVKSIQTYSGLAELTAALEEYQEEYTVLMAADEANHILFPGRSPQESIDYAVELLAEKALALKKDGKTLFDFLIQLYRQYGFYHEKSFTISRDDEKGEKYIKNIMVELRKQTSDVLFGNQVRVVNDFEKAYSYNLMNAKKTKTTLPKANVLQFIFTDYTKITFAALEDYSRLFYHFSVGSRITGADGFDEAKKLANEKIIGMMERLGKI